MVMEAQRPDVDGSPIGEGQQASTLLGPLGLRIAIPTPQGTIYPANGVTLSVDKGRALAVLGESGSGKSVTMQAVVGLTYRMGGQIIDGSISFRGMELVGLARARRPQALRQRDRHGLPGSAELAQPRVHGRQSNCGDVPVPSLRTKAARLETRRGDDG